MHMWQFAGKYKSRQSIRVPVCTIFIHRTLGYKFNVINCHTQIAAESYIGSLIMSNIKWRFYKNVTRIQPEYLLNQLIIEEFSLFLFRDVAETILSTDGSFFFFILAYKKTVYFQRITRELKSDASNVRYNFYTRQPNPLLQHDIQNLLFICCYTWHVTYRRRTVLLNDVFL